MKIKALISIIIISVISFSCVQSSPVDSTNDVGRGAPFAGTNEPEEPAAAPEQKEEPAQGSDSVYTDLASAKCKNIELDEEGAGWSVDRCEGAFGFTVEVSEGDLRQTIAIIDPKGKRHELDLWNVVSSAFSTVGEKAEWRFRTKAGKKVPFAFIVRFNASENPEKPEIPTSYLTVSKITEDDICVTDIVKPIANANVEARKLAETAADKPCLKRD